MIDLTQIPASKDDLDAYEVNNLFHSWSFQPSASPPRVVSAKGCRFTTEDGRERLDLARLAAQRQAADWCGPVASPAVRSRRSG